MYYVFNYFRLIIREMNGSFEYQDFCLVVPCIVCVYSYEIRSGLVTQPYDHIIYGQTHNNRGIERCGQMKLHSIFQLYE